MFAENPFVKATKEQAKLRLAIVGTSGTGKTYTGIQIATHLGKTAVIDTERGSARKYGLPLFDFDVLELENHHPQNYINAIKAAVQYGYEVLVIDSLSHAWSGAGGVLEMVDSEKKRSKNPNSFAAWGNITPLQNQLVDTILSSGVHIIATLRAKTEYVTEVVNGKNVPRKVGLAPIQRDGIEYEFDVVGDMDTENNFIVTKTRCPELNGMVYHKPGADLAGTLKAWLGDGQPVIRVLDKPKPVITHTEETPDTPEPEPENKLPEWVTVKNVTYVAESLHKNGLGDADITRLIMGAHIHDLEAWGQWESGKDAAAAVLAAWEHEQAKTPPAQPKSNGDGKIMTTLEKSIEEVRNASADKLEFDRLLALVRANNPGMLSQESNVVEVRGAIEMERMAEERRVSEAVQHQMKAIAAQKRVNMDGVVDDAPPAHLANLDFNEDDDPKA